MFGNEEINRAYKFAKEKHEGQVRKYSGLPYIIHPIEVATLVSLVTEDEEVIMAALLHDVVEDTDTTLSDISRLFGIEIADLVWDLTCVSALSGGNRAKRKKIDRDHTAQACNRAKTIKIADLICNTRSIIREDKKFASVYIPEKLELLKVLTDGNIVLYNLAFKILIGSLNQLEEL